MRDNVLHRAEFLLYSGRSLSKHTPKLFCVINYNYVVSKAIAIKAMDDKYLGLETGQVIKLRAFPETTTPRE